LVGLVVLIVAFMSFDDDAVPLDEESVTTAVSMDMRSSVIKISSSVSDTSIGISNDPKSSAKSASEEPDELPDLLPDFDFAADLVDFVGAVVDAAALVLVGRVGVVAFPGAFVGTGAVVRVRPKFRKDLPGQVVGLILGFTHEAAVRKQSF